MKRPSINHKVVMPIIFSLVMVLIYFLNKDDENEVYVKKELKFNERVEKDENLEAEKSNKGESKNDINILSVEDMAELGISKAVAEKIVTYRELTGTVKSFDELKRIKGIGEKTAEKIKKTLVIDKKNIGKKNKINVNTASDDELSFYGFTKKELEKISKWKLDVGPIFSNIDLIKILGERRYDQIKGDISY